MAIRMSKIRAERLMNSIKECRRNPDAIHRMAKEYCETLPMGVFKVNTPGSIKADFKVESETGATAKEVFGELTVDNVLSVCSSKVEAGEFKGKFKMSKRVTGNIAGGLGHAEGASDMFLRELAVSGDEAAADWSVNKILSELAAAEAEELAAAEAEKLAEAEAEELAEVSGRAQ